MINVIQTNEFKQIDVSVVDEQVIVSIVDQTVPVTVQVQVDPNALSYIYTQQTLQYRNEAEAFAQQATQIYVGTTAPLNPFENQLWLDIS